MIKNSADRARETRNTCFQSDAALKDGSEETTRVQTQLDTFLFQGKAQVHS